jgi:uncharacterized protein with NAD-binding domain and iron-sulfur cluster
MILSSIAFREWLDLSSVGTESFAQQFLPMLLEQRFDRVI